MSSVDSPQRKTIHSYKELLLWQKAMDLVVAVYQVTERYPQDELYGLTAQTRRSAVSIPSNIAEGRMRKTRKDFHNFVTIAYGSGAELETQIEIAKRLRLGGGGLDFSSVDSILDEVMRMLNKMSSSLKAHKLVS